MRPYTDLIQEITIDGETFVPIKKIAALAFGYKEECIYYKYSTYHNSYFNEVHCLFSTRNGIDCQLHIDKWFDISRHFIMPDKSITLRQQIQNQVQIFKLLQKWGFI